MTRPARKVTRSGFKSAGIAGGGGGGGGGGRVASGGGNTAESRIGAGSLPMMNSALPPGALGITIGGETEVPRETVSDGQNRSGGITFGNDSYDADPSGRYSDNNDDEERTTVSACIGGGGRGTAAPRGRDTLGFAFTLGGVNKGTTRCPPGTLCDEDCGYGNGCDEGCAEAHGVTGSIMAGSIMGKFKTGGGAGGGYSYEMNQLNFFITFMLEVLGVLVFFAVCTITFWITLGYHLVTLLVDLKNADRNIQVAVAIIVGILLLAFAISTATNSSGSCCHARDRHRHRPHCARSSFLANQRKPKPIGHAMQKATACSKAPRSPCSTVTTSCKKPRYSDCEGRAIFINSRRYAIPTEMKQPPTMILWLRDIISRWMR